MECEFSVELGPDDPTLAVPWCSPDGTIQYLDLRANPAAIRDLPEILDFPELADFLRVLNTGDFATAKCDAWFDTQMDVDDEPYGAAIKCASYVDVYLANQPLTSFEEHERRARNVVKNIRNREFDNARAEIVIRRAFFSEGQGCYWTIYSTGYGNDQALARENFAKSLKIMSDALSA